MLESIAIGGVGCGPLVLLSLGLLPDRGANRRSAWLCRGLPWVLAATFGGTAAAAAMIVRSGTLQWVAVELPWGLGPGVYLDSLAAIMLLLISFIGAIIARFAARYLAGEAHQGQFLKWMGFTLGAVMLSVMACNLVLFVAAWLLTSLGLHQLLTHYRERPWAVWAARKKFLISRIGDLSLLAALGLTWYVFRTWDYGELFAHARALQATGDGGAAVTWIGLLFAIGAMTKSAQFPFHSWLPDTLETPTPVSALMHAGVINAGGFLVLRLNPLLTLSPAALQLLLVVGAFTALFAGVVMMTQTSVKRALAWSTIAQMGFMMLQCGLGAFTAALLHIVAHSLYKAHAFLTTGSVIEWAARLKLPSRSSVSGALDWLGTLAGVVLSGAVLISTAWLVGIDLAHKPGAALLGLVLVLAVAQLSGPALASGSLRLAIRGLAGSLVVCSSYWGMYLLVDYAIAGVVLSAPAPQSMLHEIVVGLVAAGFLGVFGLQLVMRRWSNVGLVRSFYVHAANGFYLDVPARRLTARLWGGVGPTP